MRPLQEIIVHCTATPEGRHEDVASIRAMHLARGFTDIGYHFLIHLDGTIEIGRPLWKIGAHCSGRNAGTVGIAYVGGVEKGNVSKAKDTRTPAQKASIRRQLTLLCQDYPSIVQISGHNSYSNKACPSFKAEPEFAGMTYQAHPKALVEEGFVLASVLNVRQAPGGSIVGKLQKNARVQILERKGDWARIEFGRNGAWVAHDFLGSVHA